MTDIRWKQRFNNYISALSLLEECIPENQNKLSNKDRLALIQAYEMTVELGWNMLKDYMEYQGMSFRPLPMTIVREAFNKSIIPDAQVWIDAIKKRNISSHTYNKDIAEELTTLILEQFYPAFMQLRQIFTRYAKED